MKKFLNLSITGAIAASLLMGCSNKAEVTASSPATQTPTSTVTPNMSPTSNPTPTPTQNEKGEAMMKLESELKQDQSIKFITWSPDKIQVLYFKMKNAETGVAYLQKVGADAQQIVDIPKPAGFKWNNQGTAFYALESFATGKLGYDKVSATIYKVSDLKQQVAGIRAYPDLLWDESGKNVIFSTFETDKNKKVTAWSSIKVKNIETNSDYKELKNSGSASVYFKLDRVENGGLYYKKINRDDNTSTEEKIPIN